MAVSLFLTSKVRLHCDKVEQLQARAIAAPFPDLKGQAPLRRGEALHHNGGALPFPDLKGQAPLRLSRPTSKW